MHHPLPDDWAIDVAQASLSRIANAANMALEAGDMESFHSLGKRYHELADWALQFTGTELRPTGI